MEENQGEVVLRSVEDANYWIAVDAVHKAFREFVFEPGTGFTCDLAQYPATQHGKPNFALRAYKSTYDNLSEHNRMLIAEQISELVKQIRFLGVNCILEVHDAPGESGSQGRD